MDPGVALGAYLRGAREARGFSVEAVSAATRFAPRVFTITLGNAGGVRLELDGRALPPLKRSGEVVRDVVVPGESSS